MNDDSMLKIDASGDMRQFWIDLFRENFRPEPGGVFAFFGGYQRCLTNFSVPYELVIRSLVDSDGQPLYENSFHIISKNNGKVELKQSFLETLRKYAEIDGSSIAAADRYLETVNFEASESYDAEQLVSLLETLPQKSSVYIHYADRYRFPALEAEGLCVGRTLQGMPYRLNVQGELGRLHYEKLIEKALEIASSRQLVVILAFEDISQFSHFSDDLKVSDSLAVMDITEPPENLKMLDELRHCLEHIDELSVEDALGRISAIGGSALNIASFHSAIYKAKGLAFEAWRIIEPFVDEIIDSQNIDQTLFIAQTSYAAGKREYTERSLMRAESLNPSGLEQLNTICLIWKSLGEESNRVRVLEQMEIMYPNSQPVRLEKFQEAFRNRDYTTAKEMSVLFGDNYHIAVCDCFSSDVLQIKQFLTAADTLGARTRALYDLAEESCRRGRYGAAWRFLRELDFTSNIVALKFRILAKRLIKQGQPNEALVECFCELLSYVALNPSKSSARFAFEAFLEDELEDYSVISLLLVTLDKGATQLFVHVMENQMRNEVPWLNCNPSDKDLEDSVKVFSSVLESCSTKEHLLGVGDFPNEVSEMASNQVLYIWLRSLQEDSSSPDEVSTNSFIHAICLLSSHLKEPSSDVFAFRAVIARLSMFGEHQRARDLAEHALCIMPASQSQFSEWRTALAWSCWGDAYLRSNNTVGALGALCLCLFSIGTEIESMKVVKGLFNLCARVTRDVRMFPLALKYLQFERNLMMLYRLETHTEYQIYQLEHAIQTCMLTTSSSASEIETLLNEGIKFLATAQEDDTEIEPMLSSLVTLLSRLKSIKADVNPQYEKVILDYSEEAKPLMRELLLMQIEPKINRADLIDKAHRFGKSRAKGDLSFQTKPIRIAAEHAIKHAYDQQDVDLFITASCLLCQPTLSLEVGTQNEANSLVSSNDVNELMHELANGGVDNLQQIIDAATALKATCGNMDLRIEGVIDLTWATIQQYMSGNEQIILLSHDLYGDLYQLTIRQGEPLSICRLSPESWDPKKYREWKRTYPYSYGNNWTPIPPQDIFSVTETPSVTDVELSTTGLNIAGFDAGLVNIVVADSELFGFPYGILFVNDSFLGQQYKIVCAPSLSWFLGNQTAPLRGFRTRSIAWLGKSGKRDCPLEILDLRIRPSLLEYKIELNEAEFLESFKEEAFCVVAGHGGVGGFGQFSSVSNAKKTRMSPEEFAAQFTNCGCLILLICSAGRSDEKLGTSETKGLVSALLRKGVQSVIAPVWPLHLDVAEIWLPAFLDKFIKEKLSAGDAAFAASREVENRYSNPCAWGAMQVYGDYFYSLGK